jgi:hypothetical protein
LKVRKNQWQTQDHLLALISIITKTTKHYSLVNQKTPKHHLPFTIQDWSAKASMPQSQWEAIVREKINKTNKQNKYADCSCW